ncbi:MULTISPECIES: SRPBCC family protein [unclassified Bacillus (in: firmicutes)]|uniref:SRPBCC family protein n=1 Tax=unclassified Bacillus (in: firmicutes) TaxID=185979 RepID=UPI0008EF353D|nr:MULTISPECIES: SRPBCC family protein [unclassified Bacillus (in: firmicutes)]SFH94941.1 Polyketide cyclase / dehydrase and lipid transport [Bacillus sp. 71mf]SFS95233.1 Polyketide cyclase / dehydrase and lipid transport [Bacillus sp. 103mf]
MSFALEIVIQAPIDIVFDYVNNDEKIKEWNTFIVENRYASNVDKKNPRVGDKCISVQKIGKKIFEVEVELLEYDAPYIVSVGGEMKQGYSTTTYILEEDEEGTVLTLISEYEPRNLFYNIVYKLTGWMSRGLYMQEIERLAECVETAYYKEK